MDFASARTGMIYLKRPSSITIPSVVLYQSVLALRPAKLEPLLALVEA
jgi:hypothetical protein